MRYVKAVAIGVATGIGITIVWIVATLLLPIAIQLIRLRDAGSGGIGAVSGSIIAPELVFALGFILGFALSLRRSRRKAAL